MPSMEEPLEERERSAGEQGTAPVTASPSGEAESQLAPLPILGHPNPPLGSLYSDPVSRDKATPTASRPGNSGFDCPPDPGPPAQDTIIHKTRPIKSPRCVPAREQTKPAGRPAYREGESPYEPNRWLFRIPTSSHGQVLAWIGSWRPLDERDGEPRMFLPNARVRTTTGCAPLPHSQPAHRPRRLAGEMAFGDRNLG